MNIRKSTRNWLLITIVSTLIFLLALFPVPAQNPIKYVERSSGEIKIENVYGENWLNWLYHNPVGQATLWAVAKRKIVSSIYGDMMSDPSSAEEIMPFVKEYKVDLSIAQEKKFSSFNDFFVRKLKPEARPINQDSLVVTSPADGKILAYQNLKNSDFYIKGVKFNVASFLDDATLAKKYEDGAMIVFRLAPPDYHRYHFPVSGTAPQTNIKIDGDYYSVNPLALRKKAEIFWLNKREFGVIQSPIFGDVIMSEVGATMVGSMIQTYKNTAVKKGEEKGYFKFGGSTVVLFFEKDRVKIDADLLKNTEKGLETTMKMGERIAEKK